LEQLFMEGKLLVVGRKGFQKIYDLPERVLPANLDQSKPTPAEFARFLIQQGIQAQGIITESQIGYLQKEGKRALRKTLQQMLETGEILQVQVEKREENYFTSPDVLQQTLRLPKQKPFFVLSPFDNFVIQRKRMQTLFGFDYQIECYVPAPQRKYGYFSLPLLWGEAFVGRVDMKADRKSQRLIIKNLVLENKPLNWEELLPVFTKSLNEFMVFNGCQEIEIVKTIPHSLKKQLKFLQ